MDREEYAEWKSNPLTTKFHQFLRDKRKELMESWADGNFSHPNMEQAAVLNAAAMGRAQCLAELADLEDDFISNFYRHKGSDDVPAN